MTKAVGHVALVEDLEEQVKRARIGLLEFVEEEDRVRMLFDERRHAALDIHLGGTDELVNRLRCLEFAHIEPDHAIFVPEIDMGERFGGLGLSDTGRPQKQE